VINPGTDLRQEVSDGLLFAHGRLGANTGRTLEASAFLFALVELLNEKGVISIEELDSRKAKIAERLTNQYRELGQGVVVQDPETDKYSFEATAVIDCASKVAFCRASCCRLPFALSKQDINERLVQWDFSRPYMIAQGQSNYCVHLHAEKKCCSIREHRPTPCRGYDCRKDERIWVNFENNEINPDILRENWPEPAAQESSERP
jgi:Fe-S-cluster containining protein